VDGLAAPEEVGGAIGTLEHFVMSSRVRIAHPRPDRDLISSPT
jgi:hypothetical protein